MLYGISEQYTNSIATYRLLKIRVICIITNVILSMQKPQAFVLRYNNLR